MVPTGLWWRQELTWLRATKRWLCQDPNSSSILESYKGTYSCQNKGQMEREYWASPDVACEPNNKWHKTTGERGGVVLHLQERRLALLGRTLTTSLAVKLCERDIPEVNLLHGAVQPGMQELQLCPSVRPQAPFALLIRTYSSTHFGAGLLATHCSGCSHFCSSSDSSSVLSKGDSSQSGTSPSRP